MTDLERVDEIVAGEVLPLEEPFLAGGFAAVAAPLEAVRETVRAAGLWAPHLDRPLTEFALVAERLGRTPLGHFAFGCQAPDAGNMEVLAARGTEAQKARWLEPLAAGRVRSCFAMTEPDRPGSNPSWMATVARREGDEYVVDGRKWFASSADGAAFALAMVVTDPAAEKRRRASILIVPTDAPGFRLVRNLPVMGETGTGYASHGEVVFEGCRVPVADRLGDEGAGFAIAQERLGPGRIHHAMRWLGVAGRAFDLLCQRAATRPIAPDAMLGERGVVREWIAESAAELAAARLLVLDAAARVEAGGTRAAAEAIALVKFHTAGVLGRVLDRAIQAHGALGLTDLTPLAYWYRHERAARIYDGPDEVHKAWVARRILARYEKGATDER